MKPAIEKEKVPKSILEARLLKPDCPTCARFGECCYVKCLNNPKRPMYKINQNK